MSNFISQNKFYTLLLLILPSLIAVSWINAFQGNFPANFTSYLLTHVLPAVLLSYVVSLITAEYLHKMYQYSYARVLFTLTGLIASLYLFSFVLSFFGFDSQFLTAKNPTQIDLASKEALGIEAANPVEAASKLYSAQLLTAFVMLVILYSIASAIFITKKRKYTKRGGADDDEVEETVEKPFIKPKKTAAKKKPERKVAKKEKQSAKTTSKKAANIL